MNIKNVVLIVLDGWGIGRKDAGNPIYVANPETLFSLEKDYPTTSLQASGIAVGLPWGEVGNSEVGHLTMGAGKVLYQYYPKITMAIEDGSFYKNKVLNEAFDYAEKNNSSVNFVGLLSDANIHAAFNHLLALLKMAEYRNFKRIKLQLFADGNDSPPRSVKKFLSLLPQEYISTLIGRYWALEKEGRWQLTEVAYQLLTNLTPEVDKTPFQVVDEAYARDFSDKYIPGVRFKGKRGIDNGDAVIFFNYREDGIRQLAAAFLEDNFDKFQRVDLRKCYFATFTSYQDDFKVPVAFSADVVKEPLGKIISDYKMTQMRLAETFKYAHVTYFFNGLREEPFPGEYRVLIPSIEIVHKEERPEMRAREITERLIQAISGRSFNFILVNYANADTIGHTADFDAGVKTIKVIDQCISDVVKVSLEQEETVVLITGDHGNIEEMINPETGEPESGHKGSPVPFYVIHKELYGRKFPNYNRLRVETLGTLADVAPTILALLNLPKGKEMTGVNLLDNLI